MEGDCQRGQCAGEQAGRRGARHAKARGLATDARAHVREMHKAAMKGDAEGARAHAAMALPFVYQLIDWSS